MSSGVMRARAAAGFGEEAEEAVADIENVAAEVPREENAIVAV